MIVIETFERGRAPRASSLGKSGSTRHDEVASPATPQLSSLLPPRRRRSPNDAPGASREHTADREKYDPTADREHSLATLYPSKSSLIVIPTARQQTPATLKSP